MKLIIDIPEDEYVKLKANNYWADRNTHELIEEAVINGTPIEEHSELFNDLKQGLQEAIELEKEKLKSE